MSYTFLNQQEKLSVLLGDSNTGTDDAFPLALRKKEINRGELHYARNTKLLREKATGTISGNSISIPSDWLETVTLVVGTYVLTKKDEISIQDYERWSSYGGSRPVYYMSEESGTRYFKFLGTGTGSTYSLYYIKRPTTELSSDSDVSLFPEEFREASVYYAAGELLQQQGKNDISDRYLNKYAGMVRDGRDYAEETYVTQSYANPDVNMIGNSETDMQGGGF